MQLSVVSCRLLSTVVNQGFMFWYDYSTRHAKVLRKTEYMRCLNEGPAQRSLFRCKGQLVYEARLGDHDADRWCTICFAGVP